jgi:tRNA(His) 5'-end guanylyltransferase
MKVDAFNRQMRLFETAHDHHFPLGIYMVVRIDGRGFSRLTKEVHKFEPL